MATDPSTQNRPSRWRSAGFRRGLQVAIAAASLYLAWRMVDSLSWQDLSERLRSARPGWVLAGSVLLLARWVAWQARWGLSLRRAGHPTRVVSRTAALMGSIFVNHIALRFFGGFLRARYTTTSQTTYARQYGIVLFDQLIHQAATTVYIWLASAYVLTLLGREAIAAAGLVALVVLAATVPLWIRRGGGLSAFANRLGNKAARSPKLGGLIKKGSELPRVLGELFARRDHVTQTACLTWLMIAANVVAQWLLFRAIDADVPFLVVASVLGLGTLMGTITGLPGGLGPMEAALIGGYGLLGVGQLEAVAGTLIYRGLHYLLVLLVGLPSLVLSEFTHERELEHEPDPAEEARPLVGETRAAHDV